MYANLGAPSLSMLPPIALTPSAPPVIIGINGDGTPVFKNLPPSSPPMLASVPAIVGVAALAFFLLRRR
jgi:hypothetical protein